MKFKKFASLVMASIMALSLSVTAFATPTIKTDTTSGDIEITGTVTAPVIKMSVPTTVSVVVNPYGLSVDKSTAQDGSDMTTDQVIFATQYIGNLSQSNVSVSVTATGTTSDTRNITFATAPIASATKKPTTKQVFMYMEVAACDKADGTADPTWAASFDAKANPNQVAIAAKQVSLNNVVTLAKADWSGYDASNPDDADISAAAAKGYAAFKLAGDANGESATAWTASDTVTVTVAFTFNPTSATVA